MRCQAIFRADGFRHELSEDDPNCFPGEDLAQWIVERLRDDPQLIGTDFSAPFEEDWGWAILVSSGNRWLLVGVGEYQIEDQLGWSCFVSSRLPFYKKWFGVSDDSERQLICDALQRALAANSQVSKIEWCESYS